MSKVGISVKIDVTKIEKARLFEGQKGKYLDATMFVDLDELDQYGNSGMITQDVTKEERDAGTKGPILGNAKVFWRDDGTGQQSGQQSKPQAKGQQSGGQMPEPITDFDEDIPF